MSNESVLESFKHYRRVYHSNTDSAGIVYYGDYFIFFEEARAEWLRSIGFNQSEFANEFGTHILVKSVREMNFLKPAKMDELIYIGSSLLSHTKVSFTIQQCAFNEADEELVKAQIDLLSVDSKTGRPKRTPQALLDRLVSASSK